MELINTTSEYVRICKQTVVAYSVNMVSDGRDSNHVHPEQKSRVIPLYRPKPGRIYTSKSDISWSTVRNNVFEETFLLWRAVIAQSV
jgi:hypothetical protein